MKSNHPILEKILLLIVVALSAVMMEAQENNQKAIDSLQFKLKQAIEDTNQVNALLAIAKNLPSKDTDLKIDYANKAFLLAKKINWPVGMMKANLDLGDICSRAEKNQKALYHYKQCAGYANAYKDTLYLAECYNCLGFMYQVANQFDSSLHYYQLTLKINPNSKGTVGILASMGVVHQNMGDYSRALDNYLEALKLNQQHLLEKNVSPEDSLSQAGLLFTLGDIYLEMSQYDKALENYNKVLAISKELADPMFEMLAFSGIAKTYTPQKNYVQAAGYFEKALAVSRSSKDEINESGILNDLANVYYKMGDLKKALTSSRQALTIIEHRNYNNNLPKVFTTLGRIYAALNANDDAINYLRKSINTSQEIGAVADQRDAWQELSKVYEAIHKPVEALQAFQYYIQLRDSIYNVDKARQMTSADMQFKFETQRIADSLRQSVTFDLKMQRQRLYTISSIAGLAIAMLLAFFIFKGYSRAKKSNVIITRAHATIEREKQVSENLLLNILPKNVAEELKDHGKVKAKLFDHVTVLFTDFVNFTHMAEILSPEELIAELDTCFKAFDEITLKYKIEKIKTVGDAYLAVSGLPDPCENHASELVKAAIDMRDFMSHRRKQLGERTFEIRLGLNSGKVITGIVGMKKFVYDVWGDTVNIAARMEQSGDKGKINISETTYQLIKHEFTCSYRGEHEAKNKGLMKMYFVETV